MSKNLNASYQYIRQKRGELYKKQPNLKCKQIYDMLASEWKVLPLKKKAPYKKMALSYNNQRVKNQRVLEEQLHQEQQKEQVKKLKLL